MAQLQTPAKASVAYRYLLYVPRAYPTTKMPYPLVIYLHGGSQRGNDLEKLRTYGPPHAVAQGRQFTCLIASPQCPDGNYWSTDNWLDSLLADLTTRYRVDPKRIYLTGISMGGYGTWQTATAHPNTFAAIAPLCGSSDDSTQVYQLKHIPVWAFHGTADEIPPDETTRLVNRLRACGGRVRLTKLTGKGHDIQYLCEEKAVYWWLLRQRRQDAAVPYPLKQPR